MRFKIKWIPNTVSMLRGALSVILFICALRHSWLAAALMAVLAFATDALDGWLAYWLNARSDLGGKLIDPANDSLLSVALIAGLFFTGTIGWRVILFLASVAVIIWVPIILLNDHWWRRKLVDLSRYYYVAVVALFTGLYFYKAIGSKVMWLVLPALLIGIGISYARESRRFIL